jgi:hypothetical protein
MGTDRDQDDSGIQKRRERYGMLEDWLQDALDREQKRSVGPEGQRVFEAMQAWLKSYNEMVRRMTEALRESAPEPPKAEDASEGKDEPSGSWRDRPPLL